MTKHRINTRNRQNGNALFLILIAVILFAALSYAITQSNRSGGDPGKETNLIASTTVMQYADAVKTAMTKMRVRGATNQLDFISPDTPTFDDPPVTYKVFHPNGGGAVWQNVDPNTVELDGSGVPLGSWVFRTDTAVAGLAVGNTYVAFLTHVRKSVCETINEQLGGSRAIPNVGMDIGSATANPTLTGTGIDGQFAKCVETTDVPAEYLYYNVLVEN